MVNFQMINNKIIFMTYYYIGEHMKNSVIKTLLFILFILPINTSAASSYSALVMDIDSGRILYKTNIDNKQLIASITKIMTCIIVLENADINREIVVGDEILSMYGTNIYLEVGEKIKIEDLLYGMMLRSGNDAALSLATNTLGEEEFVEKMNEKAKELKMNNTVFENVHGLDDDTKNYSTAYDMALLGRYAYNNPIYRKIIKTKKYVAKTSLKSYVWYNRMSLLSRYKKCIGGKNGYTPQAGKTLVSYAEDNNMKLMIVSLNDSEIYENHKNLYLNYFNNYNNYLIIDKNNFQISPLIKNEKYYIKDDYRYPLASGELGKIKTLINIYPIENKRRNNIVGEISIKFGNKELKKIDIYERRSQKKKDKSIFQKIIHLFIR